MRHLSILAHKTLLFFFLYFARYHFFYTGPKIFASSPIILSKTLFTEKVVFIRALTLFSNSPQLCLFQVQVAFCVVLQPPIFSFQSIFTPITCHQWQELFTPRTGFSAAPGIVHIVWGGGWRARHLILLFYGRNHLLIDVLTETRVHLLGMRLLLLRQ